ncbi:DUF4278 domain-containing protein [Microcoleus sp. FACHB-1515]|uniref:DUF4278 domain-containing protein n=1 Tax=Cyanophyceae TaxID=3028117 RepID=UPI001689CA90|nr:DUF4278 domain-containing protein [Microcoleus sp. FACHB-1515]MBD2089816.1 DUF4278 domain-containing protein [Microcoleus sp. FACHB-1515]
MKLSYRGVDYEYNPNQKVRDLDAYGTYRGAEVHFTSHTRTQSRATGLKYRGAAYDQ